LLEVCVVDFLELVRFLCVRGDVVETVGNANMTAPANNAEGRLLAELPQVFFTWRSKSLPSIQNESKPKHRILILILWVI